MNPREKQGDVLTLNITFSFYSAAPFCYVGNRNRCRRPFTMKDEADKRKFNVVRKVAIFSPLTDDEVRSTLPFFREKKMRKSEVIFREGEPGRHFYLVRSGSVKVYKLSEDGRERILQVFGPGQFFAELPVLDGRNYPASAEALSPSTLLFVNRDDFLQILARYPQMTGKVYEIVGDRLRHFATAVTDLTLKDASRRLAGFLLAKMEAYDRLNQDEVRFPLELTHQEIASLIGTARETVSRTLRQFEKDGIIEMKDRHITVRDKSLLAQAAG